MSILKTRSRFLLASAFALAILPLVIGRENYLLFPLSLVGIYIVVNSGLDVVYGYCGQISIGQAGFYAIGAYGSALMSLHLEIPVFVSIPTAALLASLAGTLIAIPSVKLEHHFLAMVTIGFGEIVRLILTNGGGFTGGPDGIRAIPSLKIGPWNFETNTSYFYLVWGIVLLVLIIKQRLVVSRVGRAFVAIRENPLASRSFGINNEFYKVLAFTVGAFFAGLGGALYAHLIRFVSPESFSLEKSVSFLTMVLLGGAGSLLGPIFGTTIVFFLFEYLQVFGQAQMAIYGLMIICVLFFMPRGLIGKLREHFPNLRKFI